jgi:hypothetical protein
MIFIEDPKKSEAEITPALEGRLKSSSITVEQYKRANNLA